MKMRHKIMSALGALALATTLAVVPATAANAVNATITNVGSSNILGQKLYGSVYTIPPGSTLGSAGAVVIPVGQCYRIQRAPGYSYGEYCNLTSRLARYISVPDNQYWKVYRSR